MPASHQLQPFEQVDLGDKKDSLKVFEEAVMKYRGAVSQEDSDRAALPADYPYDERMSRRVYEAEKEKLQIELLKVQSWVKDSGQRVVSLFEGRDAAGKGGNGGVGGARVGEAGFSVGKQIGAVGGGIKHEAAGEEQGLVVFVVVGLLFGAADGEGLRMKRLGHGVFSK